MSTTAKVSARQRIESILDDNSFVEIGALVKARSTDFNIKTNDSPSDGVITGYGIVNGKLVYIYSQDASVIGGSVGEMHAKKIVNLYNMAMKTGAPVIGLVDSTGLRLQEAVDGLNAFGEIYLKQAMASGVIPMITAVFGSCGGGLSVVSSMGDFTFMEGEKAELFVNSPNAINENRKEVCDSASAKFQSESGTVDFVGTESEIFEGIRDLVSILPSNNEKADYEEECEDDLNRACEGMENCVEDTLIAISNISDNGYVFEVKKAYAPEMLTAFIKVNGATVGVVANRTKVYDDDDMNVAAEYEAKLTVGGCKKAAEFVEFCDAFGIAILTLTNVDGFKATMCQEKHGAKATAKLVYAFANATVPKVNILIGNAMGSAYVAMNSKAIGADVVYAWPTAKVGMMDAKSAVQIMYADEIEKADDASVIINEKTKEYNELQSNVMSAAARGYVDSIIEPVDTRKYVIGETKRAGQIGWGFGLREAFPNSYFTDVMDAEFEGHQFKIPTHYDEMLTQLYGDYMIIPPADKQVSHQLTASVNSRTE